MTSEAGHFLSFMVQTHLMANAPKSIKGLWVSSGWWYGYLANPKGFPLKESWGWGSIHLAPHTFLLNNFWVSCHNHGQAFPCLRPGSLPYRSYFHFVRYTPECSVLSMVHNRHSLSPSSERFLSHFLASRSVFWVSEDGICVSTLTSLIMCKAVCQSCSECLCQARHGGSCL